MSCRRPGPDLARCIPAAALAFAAGVVLGLMCTYNIILVLLCIFLIGVVAVSMTKR